MDKDIIYEKDATMGKKRDTYLDFMKGVAAINIIMIHTVFWSGESYVPEIVKSMALVLDVPFFFFCSGVGFTYVRSFKKTMLSLATVYKGNIIKNLIMDCQSYTKYRPNETTGGIFVSWRRKEELPTGA